MLHNSKVNASFYYIAVGCKLISDGNREY